MRRNQRQQKNKNPMKKKLNMNPDTMDLFIESRLRLLTAYRCRVSIGANRASHSLNGMFGHPETATSCGIHFLTFGVAALTVHASSDARLSATLRNERQNLQFQVSEVHFDRKRRWSLIVFDVEL
jgi:hypothetical protein